MSMILTGLSNIPLIQAGDDLPSILWDCLQNEGISLNDGDILVITQKIISKAENRLISLRDVIPSSEAAKLAEIVEKDPRFVELVLRESKKVIRTRPGTLIVEHRLGFISANAGIDHSNVQGVAGNSEDLFLLLPENPDQSALNIRKFLETKCTGRLGILIIDSHGRAWRKGVLGTSIGFSGMPGLVDMRGKPDLFGFKLRVTEIAVADELAAGASLVMGQASEHIPVVHVRGFPYPLREGSLQELIRPEERDLFR
jgi:coenzyme F420-0:L-glutamate ligase / coenzyme F420-1:gamma-L-glutamate ligase